MDHTGLDHSFGPGRFDRFGEALQLVTADDQRVILPLSWIRHPQDLDHYPGLRSPEGSQSPCRYSMTLDEGTTSAYFASMSKRLTAWLVWIRSNTHSYGTMVR